MELSETLARQLQHNLEQQGYPAPTELTPTRKKELDVLSQQFTRQSWMNLATKIAASPSMA